ncbi:MAG: sialate O-acetylesterase [Planctomycetota bacterium]
MIFPIQTVCSFLVATLLLTSSAAHAELSLPAVFGNHMVVQRNADVPFWGEAAPGARVEVRIGRHVGRATADATGAWRATLPAMPAGGPYEVTVSASTGDRLTLSDVLVGEVWLCSGQSNMEWDLESSEESAGVLASTFDDQIRLFHVPRRGSDEPIDDVQTSWVRAEYDSVRRFSGVAYFMALRLREELGVPVGLVQNAFGGAPAEAFVPIADLEADPMLRPIVEDMRQKEREYAAAMEAWESNARVAAESGQAEPPRPGPPYGGGGGWKPAALWNAMTEPISPFRFAGTVWYQGEANTGRVEQYATLLTTLIGVWRREFGYPEMPFCVVQLSSFSDPGGWGGGWPALREVQAEVADRDPLAGLVVTTDVGNPVDVHPTNKRTVGERAAAWALSDVYKAGVPAGGPTVDSIAVRGRRIYVRFETNGLGLQTLDGGPVRGFALGAYGSWWNWATAEIDGDTVVVEAPWMDAPWDVRYAWSDDAGWANLCDGAGMPARQFRSDTPAWVTPITRR